MPGEPAGGGGAGRISAPELVNRMAHLPHLSELPRSELQWLVDHGTLEAHPVGAVLAPKGRPVEKLWVILSGRVAVRVDRGAGPRLVIGWRAGEVSGMLPYSRMKGPPGDNYIDEAVEVIAVNQRHFPAMIRECPEFTAYTVHLMLDRARRFNTSDLQDEKMLSLGKLAAGLAHELNNPASAAVRGAKTLLEELGEADRAARALGSAGLDPAELKAIGAIREACMSEPQGSILSPIERADREDGFLDWLEAHGCDAGHAPALAASPVTLETLDDLAGTVPRNALDAVLRWIAVGCSTTSLAADIESAATRIYELVGAVKRFTYMDRLGGPELVEVEPGLRDTIRVLASKARTRGVAVEVSVPSDLPRVHATGGELNQVWLNLLDNALDAVGDGGHVEILARRENDRVVVSVVDDGPGIPPGVLPHIFDLFFTTKSPGQGTGLGLETARRLVRRYRGDLTVQSRPGRTEFRVSLIPEAGA